MMPAMKLAKIIHNPSAGREEHTSEQLISAVRAQGYDCEYSSTKEKGWKNIRKNTDFIIVAGGDGTVRKVVVKLLDKLRAEEQLPLVLIPLGTANNISRSLGITGRIDQIIAQLNKEELKPYDIGRVSGLGEKALFLESFGFGVFPVLMKEMKKHPVEDSVSPEKKMLTALALLHDIVMNFPAYNFEVTVDGRKHNGPCLLAEIMNINSIGPNLNFSPDADPGDGIFELVLIPEQFRNAFAAYVSGKIAGIDTDFKPIIMKGEKISILTNCPQLHVDDELVKVKNAMKITVKPDKGYMEFLSGR